MRVIRSPRQVAANKLDLDVFRAVSTAVGLSKDVTREDRAAWDTIARRLEAVRASIRVHMHPADRAATEERP